jgi:hypothetical protein
VTAFPWLLTILVLVLVAWLVLALCESGAQSVRARRLQLTRPTVRLILIVAIVELVLLLAWGLFLRPR